VSHQQRASAWYFVQNGKQYGPVSSQDLQSRLAAGALQPADMIWCEGLSDWQTAGSIFDTRVSAPPPIPQMAKSPIRREVAEQSVASQLVEGVRVTSKTGVVRDVQMLVQISSSSYGGGGTLTNGSGFIAAPTVRVTSHTMQRFFVADERGGEWQFEAGEGFAVRSGNRVKVSFAMEKNGKSEIGFARNLDSGAEWRWPMKSVLPGYLRIWVAVLALGSVAFGLLALVKAYVERLYDSTTPEMQGLVNTVEELAILGLESVFVWVPALLVILLVVRRSRRNALRERLWATMKDA
jgi:hypothetical protein